MRFSTKLMAGAALAGFACAAVWSLPIPKNNDNPMGDKAVTAQSLPGDRLPPFQMLDANGKLKPFPQGPALEEFIKHAHRQGAVESDAIGPDMEMSIDIARAAVKACRADGYLVGVAVLDTVGDARAELTADGSDGSHVFVAHRKALTALAFEMPNSQSVPQIIAGKLPMDKVTPAMFVMPGGIPIMKHGKIIGAVGVSGAAGAPPGFHDEACARAGLAAVADKLK